MDSLYESAGLFEVNVPDYKQLKACRRYVVSYPLGAVYCSVPGKCPALKHNSRFWPAWALTRDQNSMHLYRSCYIDPLKWGTWALTWQWALAQDTTVVIIIDCDFIREVMLLKSLWDVITLVKSSFEDWNTTLWSDINVEQMEMDCKKFVKVSNCTVISTVSIHVHIFPG